MDQREPTKAEEAAEWPAVERRKRPRSDEPASRRASLARLTEKPLDLLVIGGGIVGAGVARDAAMRGLRVGLVERGDFAAGTSSRSSRLIHGGLRYLEHGEIRLVAEALRERRILLTIAPHLVWPLAFTFPVHKGDRVSRWKLAAGMWLYDLLAFSRRLRRHRTLGKRGLLEAEPMIRERGLTGGSQYWDAQCDDARLVLATARSAIRHGALMLTYAEVIGLVEEKGRIIGAEVLDRFSTERRVVRASAIVNATGPWTDEVRRLENAAAEPLLRLTRGSHVVVPRERLGLNGGVTFTSRVDGRVMFALPWGAQAYVGTTDDDLAAGDSIDDVAITRDDLLYLLRSVNAEFPGAHLTSDDVIATWSGLRPLLDNRPNAQASAVSREHAIVKGKKGMWTVAGGKLTTYRSMAADVVNRVAADLKDGLGRTVSPGAATDTEPLVGGEARDLAPFREQGLALGLGRDTVRHLLRHYGAETAGILNLAERRRELLAPIHPAHPAIAAEVIHHARRELAHTVSDVLVRRVHLFYETADRGRAAADAVAQLLGAELRWDEGRVATEAQRYRTLALADPIPT